MLYKIPAKEFQLSWWRVDVENCWLKRKTDAKNLVALTINHTTDKESKLIRKWCNQHEPEIYKVTRTHCWVDWYNIWRDELNDIDVRYLNNEREVIAKESVIIKLEQWLSTFVIKKHGLFLQDIDIKDLRKIIRNRDVKLVYDKYISENDCILLYDDIQLQTELSLRFG